mmetsp:Transcript_88162/g.128890  ORF Transcript_88162/g.128890 Transcript_88162/m.128890 type:complete len:235 (-) Transcript_88162:12-716(-)
MPADTVKSPPPYSCTRVRTLKLAGVTSVIPEASFFITTTRPCSDGRPSSQYSASPSKTGAPSPTAPSVRSFEEMGESHSPYGFVCTDALRPFSSFLSRSCFFVQLRMSCGLSLGSIIPPSCICNPVCIARPASRARLLPVFGIKPDANAARSAGVARVAARASLGEALSVLTKHKASCGSTSRDKATVRISRRESPECPAPADVANRGNIQSQGMPKPRERSHRGTADGEQNDR